MRTAALAHNAQQHGRHEHKRGEADGVDDVWRAERTRQLWCGPCSGTPPGWQPRHGRVRRRPVGRAAMRGQWGAQRHTLGAWRGRARRV
jgi:hypothetical protein